MYDLKITEDGNLYINENNDLELTNSIRQQVLIKLRWIKTEWRFNEKYGLDYWGSIFVKNPDYNYISLLILSEVLSVEGVLSADVNINSVSKSTRKAYFSVNFTTDKDTYYEEVGIKIDKQKINPELSDINSSITQNEYTWWEEGIKEKWKHTD